MKTTLQALNGGTKQVTYGDPVRNLVTNERARFCGMNGEMVELMDDDGRRQPDLWNVSQIAAY